MQQRRLARSRHAGDRHQHAQRNADVDALQIVGAHAANLDLLRSRLAPQRRRLNPQILRQISSRQRSRIVHDLVVRSLGNQLAAILPGPRPQIENAVRRPHDVGIVLDHQNRVSQIAQVVQNLDQPVRIARMQPDRRLIQHIQACPPAAIPAKSPVECAAPRRPTASKTAGRASDIPAPHHSETAAARESPPAPCPQSRLPAGLSFTCSKNSQRIFHRQRRKLRRYSAR